MITTIDKSDFINDVIETDDDTLAEDQGEEGLYPYDPTEADIDIREDPQTVFELMRKYDNGKLIIEPDFQRNLVWERTQQSKFIESVILNFPIPPFYVNQKTCWEIKASDKQGFGHYRIFKQPLNSSSIIQ